MEIEAPPVPPQPARSGAATAGAYRILLTRPAAVVAMVGVDPLVRIRPNWSWRERDAFRVNRVPRGPCAVTTWVRIVPSEKVHVTVKGEAPGDP
jgi:hypothetical protein